MALAIGAAFDNGVERLMSGQVSIRLAGWQARALGRTAGAQGMMIGAPSSRRSAGGLPAMVRRRLDEVILAAAEAADAVGGLKDAVVVLGSRHGDYQRTCRLLQGLIQSGEVSPTDFSLAVHHALTGVLSMATGNRRGHTAIAAGRDSFPMAMIEAAGLLAVAPAQPVLVVYFDAELPAPYWNEAADQPTLALALHLVAPFDDHPGMNLSLTATAAGDASAGAVCNHAASFLEFLASNDPVLLVHGERHHWHWRRSPSVV